MSGAVEYDPDDYPSDQPGIIYAFDDGDEIRKVIRSGGGDWTTPLSPGDIIDVNSTRSNPTERLPENGLPGRDGLQQDDCGEDIPAFACSDCGHPVYIGRTCGSPRCERCWAAAVRSKVIGHAGKLDGLRRKLYAKYDGTKNIDFNHVVASLPDVLVDSKEPKKRVLKILKTILEERWHIEGFDAIYHPYRIKKEYRKDQYEHGGEPGEGDMTWKDVLNANNPKQYLKFEPHFHLFFPAIRKSFDYLIAEDVYENSGWVFNRITKGEDDNRSVANLDDLVHQLTYCFSHANVENVGDRWELSSRMKGDLHNIDPPDDALDQATAAVSEAAPKLLGHTFTDMSEVSCDEEVPETDSCDCDNCDDDRAPTTATTAQSTRDPRDLDRRAAPPGFRNGKSPDDWAPSGYNSTATGSQQSSNGQDSGSDENAHSGTDGEQTSVCGGDIIPMHEATKLLDDAEWVEQATYAGALRIAVAEWERLDDDAKFTKNDIDGPPPVF